MSRIEKVLEKAAEMKESGRAPVAEKTFTQEPRSAFAGFQIDVPAVNPDNVDEHLVCITEPNSVAAEQYRKLRARVLKATASNSQNAIMVTSPDMGEGKTITSINLAVSIANEIDHTVLLVDTDLRHPSIHGYLGIERGPGLSDCLTGKAELSEVLIKTGIGKLVLLQAGTMVENTAELLSSESMKALLHEVKHRYKDRYIIFDSAPLLVTSDSIPISSYMDGVILVIQASRTTPKAALHAISQIKGSNILGVVFNNVSKYLAKNLYPYYYLYNKGGYYKGTADSGGDKTNIP
jgi:protein-tyrosine kinase